MLSALMQRIGTLTKVVMEIDYVQLLCSVKGYDTLCSVVKHVTDTVWHIPTHTNDTYDESPQFRTFIGLDVNTLGSHA